MMTRKDYERAAKILRGLPEGVRHEAARAFVEFFVTDNPRFNAERFYEAVGGSGRGVAPSAWARLTED